MLVFFKFNEILFACSHRLTLFSSLLSVSVNLDILMLVKYELMYDKKVEGLIIRARARWHEHEEKNSKYFFKFGET